MPGLDNPGSALHHYQLAHAWDGVLGQFFELHLSVSSKSVVMFFGRYPDSSQNAHRRLSHLFIFPFTFGVLCEADNTVNVLFPQCWVSPVESRSQAYIDGEHQCQRLALEMMRPIYGEDFHAIVVVGIGHQLFKRRTAQYSGVT